MTTWQRIKLLSLCLFLAGLYFAMRYPPPEQATVHTPPSILPKALPKKVETSTTANRFQGTPVYGIDVSKWQGIINWEKLKKNHVQFVFIKATEGKDELDKHFLRNWKAAKQQGIYRGAYHYFVPTVPAKKQAAQFIKHVKMLKGDLPPVLDLEERFKIPTEKFQENVRIWLKEVEKHLKVKPILYASPHYYRDYLADAFGEYKVWIAKYQSYPSPVLEGTKEHWLFWQFSNRGRIAGIKGNVDLDVFYGSIQEFQQLLKR